MVHVVKELGPGINDDRAKLRHLVERHDFDILLVEPQDHLTRFGFRWFEALASFRIEGVNTARGGKRSDRRPGGEYDVLFDTTRRLPSGP